jgi:hypothetical protein
VPRVGTCSGGVCICAGGALVCLGGLCSLLEHSFVSDVSSRYPYLRGPRLVFFKWSCSLPFFDFRSLVGVSFYLFLFLFLFCLIIKCVCCQCTHQGGDWGPCVVREPVDGRFLVWWVINNIVWTDSWLSIAGAVVTWFVLVQVKNKWERSLPVRPPGVKKTSRLGLRDPVASGVKYRPHGGKNEKMKSRTDSWLSHKTKVELELRGSQVMSGDWQRLHQVRGVCGGSPENHRATQLSHKAEAEDRAWLSGQNRPNRFWVTGRRKLRGEGHASGSQGLRRGYAKCGRRASVRWCYKDKFPKCFWWVCILV